MIFISLLVPLTIYFGSTVTGQPYNNNVPPERIIYSTDGRIRGLSSTSNSNIVLGGLIPVHQTLTGTGLCSDEIYLESVDYVEAFLYSLDSINSDKNLLPNTTLGYDIRDSCITVDVAVEEAVDMALGSDTSEECSNQTTNRVSLPVSAVVGEQVSYISIPVASFFSLVKLPQISYLSTSVLLNDKEKFPYFYRTVPSDNQQAQVMIDLAVHFGWDFVSAIHSEDLYGEPGMEHFRELAMEYNICISVDRGISSQSNYNEIIDELLNSTADVIVLFASLNPSLNLFNHMRMAGVSRKFVWITSDAVSLSLAVFPEYKDILYGSLGISVFSNDDSGFSEYISSLTPANNKRNPWFYQYYELFYNCDLYNCLEFNNSITVSTNYSPLIIDAVYAFAHAFDAFVSDNCNFPISWNSTTNSCDGQKKKLSGPTLQPYLAEVNFVSPTGNHIVFDSTGSTDGRYIVTNYQLLDTIQNQYDAVTVALWNGDSDQNKHLQLIGNVSLQFGIGQDGDILTSVESKCEQCPAGNVKMSDELLCCGLCSPCLGQSYIDPDNNDASECSTCPQNMWGAAPLNGSQSCMPITKIYNSSSGGVGIFLITIACVSLIFAIIMSAFVMYKWNEVWRARESMSLEMIVLLMIAVFSCSVSVVFFVTEPSVGVCLFQRILGWICFSFLISPLLFIQIRNTWNLALLKGYMKQKFIGSIPIQLTVSLVPILCQAVFVVISLLVVHPAVDKDFVEDVDNVNDPPTLHLACVPPRLVMDMLHIFFQTFLLVILISLSVITFKVTDKLNEVKYVSFTALLLIIFWGGFVITYFVVSDDMKPIPVSITVQINALVTLVCFVMPRLLLVVLKSHRPESNPQEMEHSIRNINSSPHKVNVKDIDHSSTTVTQL